MPGDPRDYKVDLSGGGGGGQDAETDGGREARPFLSVLFRCARIGLAMRASAAEREKSPLVGIPVETMLMLGWGLAASAIRASRCAARASACARATDRSSASVLSRFASRMAQNSAMAARTMASD